MSAQEVTKKVGAVPFWWHSIDLKGILTPGHKTPEQLESELNSFQWPDLKGKTALDIGAWDGFYSFEAEKRGAKKVLALDHYVWCMDVPAMIQYWEECKKKKIVPQQYDTVPGMWRPEDLPGKKGFDTAKEILNSRVDSLVADFMQMDLAQLGVFDVVFYFGVLYHVHNPFEALKRLASVTKTLAIIETEAIVIPEWENSALVEFYETNELNGDVNNWWAPTQKALAGLCRAAGFKKVDCLTKPPSTPQTPAPSLSDFILRRSPSLKKEPLHYRAVVHAWK
ncbi:MAG: DUF1698 domain-containing protein [Elusimicrobia bacterium]|nr:DUF1698 domain-containing protein [Elusimicrobiota bacterium]